MENSGKKKGGGLPRGMPISVVVLLVLGLIAMLVWPSIVSEQRMARNVLLAAIPFILVFAAIIIAFMSLVWYASDRLGGRIVEKTYRPLEYALIAGILLGILLMFQPWVFALFRYGFYLLLASTLLYILWSHVRPKGEDVVEQPAAVAEVPASKSE
jgi:hypothetical protein